MQHPRVYSTCRRTELRWVCSIPIGLPCDSIGLLWVSHGSPLGLPCHTLRVNPSISHGVFSLDIPWDSHGTSMGQSWASHGFTVFPRVYGSGPWTSHGTTVGLSWLYSVPIGLWFRPVELPWDFHGTLNVGLWVPMGSQCNSHGSLIGLPCVSHSFPMVSLPWASHGVSMGLQWV